MIILFSFLQYKHNNSVAQTVLDAEHERNIMLINTILPIIQTNLEFGLIDSNQQYLDTIYKDNKNITMISLKNSDNKVLYTYKIKEKNQTYQIKRTISDKETQQLLGILEVHFSNIYFERMLKEHQFFGIQIIIVFIVVIAIMLWLLRRAFMPMHKLIELINAFEPKKDNFILKRTKYDDEIGIIQNALVDMIERIDLHNKELYALNNTLEEKVLKRTQALKDKKEQLENEITKVKEQEKMLIAQSRLAAMGEMMSMIAHQWRQPLATSTLMITNYKIDAMINTKERDKRDEILDDISDTLIYLSETIDDFQTYFKPDKNKDSCELHKLVERATNFSKARLQNYGVSLHVRCEEALHVQTYYNELVQIIMNIINNAIDAIIESQSSKKEIFITCKQEDKHSFIEISDSGGGISDEVIEHIFEPYFSTKGKNGTGLGLYMAKMIIKKHIDGDIKVKNIKGGARFSICF
jgi:C4-dicarboxylate-specific signal transduction histidine kinase